MLTNLTILIVCALTILAASSALAHAQAPDCGAGYDPTTQEVPICNRLAQAPPHSGGTCKDPTTSSLCAGTRAQAGCRMEPIVGWAGAWPDWITILAVVPAFMLVRRVRR
jgi:hypothetical protein